MKSASSPSAPSTTPVALSTGGAGGFELTKADLKVFHEEKGFEAFQKAGGLPAILKKLKVDPQKGIDSSEVELRKQVFGINKIPERPAKMYYEFLWDSLQDFTIQLLCVCAIISIIIALTVQRDEDLSWMEGTTILGTVCAVCNIQACQDWMKERSFRKLNAEVSKVLVKTRRNGKDLENENGINRYDLVVGDIVKIGIGDILEADGLLISGDDVTCNESALTGEPKDLAKSPEEPFLFAGTSVVTGAGIYLVTAVGVNSMNGKITALVRGFDPDALENPGSSTKAKQVAPVAVEGKTEPEDQGESEAGEDDDPLEGSVLRAKLDLLAGRIAYLAFSAAGLSATVMLVHFLIDNYAVQKRDWDGGKDPNKILKALVTGIAIVVVAVPEGLPLAVTLSLSLSVKKMQKDQNLVKHLDATETMGSATTICSDKTGTLTQNRMTVMRLYIGGHNDKDIAKKDGSAPVGELAKQQLPQDLQDKIVGAICTTKADGTSIQWDQAAGRWQQDGNKTDCALLALVSEMKVDYDKMRAQYIKIDPTTGAERLGLKTWPFSSDRKRAAQAIPLNPSDGAAARLYLKGQGSQVLRMCKYEQRMDGSIVEMKNLDRDRIDAAISRFSAMAMRCIALAYRDFEVMPDWEEELSEEEGIELTGQKAKTFAVEQSMTFLGICAIEDPLREGVRDAILKCAQAGVDVRMVTGDQKETAIAIAKGCGILRAGIDYSDAAGEPLKYEFSAMTGPDFRAKVTDASGKIIQSQFDEVWPRLRVLAQSSPQDKYVLVTGLTESSLFATPVGKKLPIYPDKQIVAVTGDGTNDAPALRKAHVGFAMKITGTRVAQDAADILLLDDNFASVVKACMWGRNVYDSIAKFLQFQLTVNISAVSICVATSVLIQEVPLSVVQMLWVNLIMDSLGALALASEAPTDALLQRSPYARGRGLISFEMRCNMIGQSVYQLIVLLILLFGAAGPRCPSSAECEHYNFKKGGFLDIESGIGRDHHADPTQHYTLVFNCFVFMTLFNWVNCRKLYHEWNALDGITTNIPFIIIWISCLGLQLLVVEAAALGGGSGTNKIFKTQALTTGMWLICLGAGFWSTIWQFIIIIIGRFLRSKLPDLIEKEWKPEGGGMAASSLGAPDQSDDKVISIPFNGKNKLEVQGDEPLRRPSKDRALSEVEKIAQRGSSDRKSIEKYSQIAKETEKQAVQQVFQVRRSSQMSSER
jgi:calcium-translocating P-type ATPase